MRQGNKDKKRGFAWKKCLLWGIGILAALVFLVLLGARLYFRLPVRDYYKASERGFMIPGCNDGFVAQGLTFDERGEVFLVNGYQKDGRPSPVYLVEKGARKAAKRLSMYLPDGGAYTGHAGGIAVYGDYVYVADGGGKRILVFSYQSLCETEDGGKLTALGTFDTVFSDTDYLGPAFVAVDGERLVIGEFYRDPNYPTPQSHKLTTLAGDYQQALAVVYELNGEAQYGIAPKPVLAYTLPDLAQGICFDGERIYVSCSWGTAKSHIRQYDRAKMQRQADIVLLGEEVELYALDGAALLADKEIAPMSEEIAVVDGKLYTMCESASDKYIFGKFTSAKWCYATDLEKYFGR